MIQKRREAFFFFQRPEEETVSWPHSSEEVCILGNPSQDLLRGAECFIPCCLAQEVSLEENNLIPGGPVWPLPIPPLSPLLHPLLPFLKKKKLFIFICLHWTVGLCCGMRDLWSLLWSVRPLLVACELLVVARGIWFPGQGLNLGPLHWELAVLATGPAGKFPSFLLSSFSPSFCL